MPETASQAAPIELDDRLAATINGARERGMPLTLAYVDLNGRPNVSPRGTVQVIAPDQLALWARTSGLPNALANNPNVALLYQDLANHDILSLTGRARVVDDAAFRNRVFEGSPDSEQSLDPDRAGTAILVELDSVRGRTGARIVTMTRDPGGLV
jgi:uncharacterized pyridoxamine 5'-phosphate oxidase family protein